MLESDEIHPKKKKDRRDIFWYVLWLVRGYLLMKVLDYLDMRFSLFDLVRYWQLLLGLISIPILFVLVYYIPYLIYKHFEE